MSETEARERRATYALSAEQHRALLMLGLMDLSERADALWDDAVGAGFAIAFDALLDDIHRLAAIVHADFTDTEETT